MALDAKEREAFVRSWGNVLMKTWEDDDFKARFEEDPAAVLRENGVELKEGAEVKLEQPPEGAGPDLDKQIDLYAEGHETGTYVFYVQDSNQLETEEISDKQLEGVAGGVVCSSSVISCCCC